MVIAWSWHDHSMVIPLLWHVSTSALVSAFFHARICLHCCQVTIWPDYNRHGCQCCLCIICKQSYYISPVMSSDSVRVISTFINFVFISISLTQSTTPRALEMLPGIQDHSVMMMCYHNGVHWAITIHYPMWSSIIVTSCANHVITVFLILTNMCFKYLGPQLEVPVTTNYIM